MSDVFTRDKRRWIMSRVKGADTRPEKLVRSLLHRMGYRFQLHVKQLPGRPDIVLPKHHKIVLVNGCFWHGHRNCGRATRPASNVAFWDKKIDGNIKRDRRNLSALRSLGWRVLVVWECETRDRPKLIRKLRRFMSSEVKDRNQ